MVIPMTEDDTSQVEVVVASAEDETRKILKDLLENISKVEAALVASADGLPIAAELPSGVDELIIGAMTAAVLSSSGRASEELQKGNLDTIMIKSEEGMIFIKGLENAVLTVLAKSDVNVGLLLIYMDKACKQIAEIVSKSWITE